MWTQNAKRPKPIWEIINSLFTINEGWMQQSRCNLSDLHWHNYWIQRTTSDEQSKIYSLQQKISSSRKMMSIESTLAPSKSLMSLGVYSLSKQKHLEIILVN